MRGTATRRLRRLIAEDRFEERPFADAQRNSALMKSSAADLFDIVNTGDLLSDEFDSYDFEPCAAFRAVGHANVPSVSLNNLFNNT